MTAKKKYTRFSDSYVVHAKDAGIDNTYIPETWKIFFKAENSNIIRATRAIIAGRVAGHIRASGIVSKDAFVNRAAPKKAAAKKAAPKKAAAKKAAPKKAAAKKAAPKKAAPKKAAAKKAAAKKAARR